MKRIELLFSALLVPIDYLMVVGAGLAAYALRFGDTVTGLRPVFYDLPLADFVPVMLVAAGLFVVVFALSGLYAIRGTRKILDEVMTIFLAVSTGIMAIIIVFFFQREFFSSRFIILSGWVLAIVFVTVGRLVVRSIQRALIRRGIGTYTVAIFGQDPTTASLVAAFANHPSSVYRVLARYPDVNAETLIDLEDKLHEHPVDIVLQADPTLPRHQTNLLTDFAIEHHCTFRYAADLFNAQATNIAVETFAGIPIIEIKKTKLDGWGRIFKRVFDLVVAGIGVLLLAPLFGVIAIFIIADSTGPVFYRSRRVGEHGKEFHVFKFRSMIANAHALKPTLQQLNERKDGPLFKISKDPRVTRVGTVIRRTSLDELPQLFNVLRGEMSLVGPRPHEPEEVAQYRRNYKKLLTIKPGITGLAQISGRSDLAFDEEARLDIYYIENWSIVHDLRILAKTPAVVLGMKSAA